MRIAVVGTGISGLVCAHLLSRRHEVEVFEAAERPGGHTNTVVVNVDGRRHAVDTGFIVFNDRTYPGFQRLLASLGVAWQRSEMSFSVRCERTGLEYAGGSWNGLFAQRRNLLRPSFHRMLRDVVRFQREARELLGRPDEKATLGAWLDGRGYGPEFVDRHLLPMGAAIWSSPERAMRDFPVRTFVRFFHNHGLLDLRDRPEWRTVVGGARTYVDAILAPLRDRVHLATPVLALARTPGGVALRTRGGESRFDHVVVATHSDQALALLAAPTPLEREVLSSIRYRPNEALLHTDRALLPRSRRAWAAWNHHLDAKPTPGVGVTYYMNRLQRLDLERPLLVTLNRSDAVDPARVLRRIRYAHPIFDEGAIQAQAYRDRVSGADRIHYCGAYWRYGFHEDGVASALAVTRAFGMDLGDA